MRSARLKRITWAGLLTGLSLIWPLVAMAQIPVAPTFQGAVNDIRTIAVAAGTLVAGLVGLIGLGRTAYKLSQGDTDSMTALIFAIVGIVLGFLANTFIA
jgi:FtsH-binding integral membrane protein